MRPVVVALFSVVLLAGHPAHRGSRAVDGLEPFALPPRVLVQRDASELFVPPFREAVT